MTDFPTISAARKQLLETATERYSASLAGSPGEEYLTGRGISSDVAGSFRLGYVAEPCEGHDGYMGRIAIPYVTPSGVSALRFRAVADGGPKYLQESGSFSPLFNVRDLHRPESHIALCEGELDAVVMSGLCGVPAVALAGVDQWEKNKRIYRRMLEDYQRVFVVMDPDKAGQNMAKKIVGVGHSTTNITLPADVNDTFSLFGADFVREAMGL